MSTLLSDSQKTKEYVPGKKTGQAINLFRSPHRQDTKGLPFLDSLIMADKTTLFQSNRVKKTNEMSKYFAV